MWSFEQNEEKSHTSSLQGFDKILRKNISFLSLTTLIDVDFLNFVLSFAEIQPNSRGLRKENCCVSSLPKLTQ